MKGVQRTSADNNSLPPDWGTNNEHSTEEVVPPDSRCPICLDRFNDVSYADGCKHILLLCIETWIQENGSCSLCRQPYRIQKNRNNDQKIILLEVGGGPAIHLAVLEEGHARNVTSWTNESSRALNVVPLAYSELCL
ncbi:hypothetical protein XELAEV_18002755mg [Xenopus laevis]|nr:hypothetical protein XELAEV_18002755mg [Xenopus laevis]